jgi:hypothetical protein
MVIIEAHRVSCWNSLIQFFVLETVEQCVIECATGNRLRKDYLEVDTEKLRMRVKIHAVTEMMRVAFLTSDPRGSKLDPGERDLLAYALSQKEAWLLCDPDKAAILSAHRLDFLDRVVALEDMALAAGLRKQGFGRNHTKNWLAEFKTKVRLGML